MKTKGLVYLASTAILLAASANSVFADETNQAANDRQQTEPSVAVTNRDAGKQSDLASKPLEVDSETKKDSGVSEASLGKDEKVASSSSETAQSAVQISDENQADTDPRKAAIAAAIARAKAKKAAQQAQQNEQH